MDVLSTWYIRTLPIIHYAFDLRWSREINVDPSIAFIYHYRTDQISHVTVDTTVYDKYASSLSRIKNVYKEFYRNEPS